MLVGQAEEDLALSRLILSCTACVVDDFPLSGEGWGDCLHHLLIAIGVSIPLNCLLQLDNSLIWIKPNFRPDLFN